MNGTILVFILPRIITAKTSMVSHDFIGIRETLSGGSSGHDFLCKICYSFSSRRRLAHHNFNLFPSIS